MYKVLIMLILLFSAGLTVLNAQNIKLSGSVSDSLKVPLSGANLIAIPQSTGDIKFAITDYKGEFTLNLSVDETYKLEISFIGFKKFIDTIQISQNYNHQYILYPSHEELEEIVIRQTIPVLVKKDTIQYRTKYFTDGKERKLYEILEKLPGIEVSNGNVYFKGKKIEKILVENKNFFTGDSKLAIENIPADAVKEVEVLENYSEIPFLKNLEESDRTVMNIKLTEGKKRFVFGDIEAGGGIDNRYLVHPTLFYYSPQTAINFIGDVNNVGTKKFTLENYINFEGGYNSLMDDPTKFSLINDEFAQSLSDENFLKNTINFGAANLHQQLGKNINLNIYSIRSYSSSQHEIKNIINYRSEIDTLTENRLTDQKKHLGFSLNKVELKFVPNENEHLNYQAYLKSTKLDSDLNRVSDYSEYINNFSETENPNNLSFEQNLQYSKQHNYKNTTSAVLIHSIKKDNNKNKLKFTNPIFNSLIPLKMEDLIRIINEQSSSSKKIAIRLKHYYIINGRNHIYPAFGTDVSSDSYSTLSYQMLEDNSINEFQNSGFNNDTKLQLVNYYTGFHYKYKNGNWMVKPGVFYRLNTWNLSQFETTQTKKNAFISPELLIDYEWNSSHQLKFNYQLNSDFTTIKNLSNRYQLVSFNRLFRGNNSLENNRFHTASLRYFRFELFKNYFLNLGIQMRSQYKGIQQETELKGIEQVSTLRFAKFPLTSWNFQGNMTKTIKDLKLKLNTTLLLNQYESVLNQKTVESHSKTYKFNLSAELLSNQFRELKLGVHYQKSLFYSGIFTNNTIKINPYIKAGFLWNNLLITADYEFQYYSNSNNSSSDNLNFSNLSILYFKDKSPWSIELAVRNIFNYNNRRQTTQSEYLVEDTFIAIQPRIALITLSYKL